MGYLKKQGIYISNESWVSFKIRKINNNLTSLDDQIRKNLVASQNAVDCVVSMMFKGDYAGHFVHTFRYLVTTSKTDERIVTSSSGRLYITMLPLN